MIYFKFQIPFFLFLFLFFFLFFFLFCFVFFFLFFYSLSFSFFGSFFLFLSLVFLFFFFGFIFSCFLFFFVSLSFSLDFHDHGGPWFWDASLPSGRPSLGGKKTMRQRITRIMSCTPREHSGTLEFFRKTEPGHTCLEFACCAYLLREGARCGTLRLEYFNNSKWCYMLWVQLIFFHWTQPCYRITPH